jgi:hypothetical protein
VPVNDLLDLVPSLTRKWLRRLFSDKTSEKATASMCERAGLDINFIKTGNVQDL